MDASPCTEGQGYKVLIKDATRWHNETGSREGKRDQRRKDKKRWESGASISLQLCFFSSSNHLLIFYTCLFPPRTFMPKKRHRITAVISSLSSYLQRVSCRWNADDNMATNAAPEELMLKLVLYVDMHISHMYAQYIHTQTGTFQVLIKCMNLYQTWSIKMFHRLSTWKLTSHHQIRCQSPTNGNCHILSTREECHSETRNTVTDGNTPSTPA